MPASRKAVGARSLPGGEAYYRWLVADHTTTAMTPDQIHELGLTEVTRIRAQMEGVMAETGFKGDLTAFIAILRSDPRFYATSREELLEKASEIDKRIDDLLPRYFGTLPRLTYGVRPVPAEIEEGYTSARYFEGAPKQGVAGGYMVNTSHLDQRPLYELPALTAARGGARPPPADRPRPGAGRRARLPPQRRRHRLHRGLGALFRAPGRRDGHLPRRLRAVRPTLDGDVARLPAGGRHRHPLDGLDRRPGEACFTDNTALSPLNIENELARYVGWPGQALAYKVGELKIQELRDRAKTALGDRFDIRRFHDAVLLAGPLPMDLLEARVDAWIATETTR